MHYFLKLNCSADIFLDISLSIKKELQCRIFLCGSFLGNQRHGICGQASRFPWLLVTSCVGLHHRGIFHQNIFSPSSPAQDNWCYISHFLHQKTTKSRVKVVKIFNEKEDKFWAVCNYIYRLLNTWFCFDVLRMRQNLAGKKHDNQPDCHKEKRWKC